MGRWGAWFILAGGLLLSLAACSLAATAARPSTPATGAVVSPQAKPSTPLPLSPTKVPSATPLPPSPTPLHPTATLPVPTPCEEDICVASFDLPLARPIAPPGRMGVDISYRFGTTQQGQRDPHHGVEFLNSYGTPVLAAADGDVIFAGDDFKTIHGLYYNFYGNFVIIRHQVPAIRQPVYTLYAHLSKISTRVGAVVKTGDPVGEVGASGAATGSHLHFEVRVGENTYSASRNPELWLAPLTGEDGQLSGALGGRVIDPQGKSVELPNIVIERLDGPGIYYLNTYLEPELAGLPPWGDSFGMGDLPPGEYQVTFTYRGMQQRVVQVQPGRLTLVTFRVPE